MANIDREVLNAAYEDGAFYKPPNALQNSYFRASIITAWEIIDIIKSRSEIGIESETISTEMDVNINTIRYFLRWLTEKNLIEFETPKGDQDRPMQSRIYRIKKA